jgi:hypothetical protein
MPSDDEVLGDDALAEPTLGAPAGDGRSWFAFLGGGNRVRFLDVMAGPTSREVYTAVYLRRDAAGPAVIGIGPDDGARIWLNGDEIGEIGGCQGTNVDQWTYDVELVEGWNRVVLKIRDHGGGWAMYFRFLDVDGNPLADQELSFEPDDYWMPGQSDLDGDGLGDVCDQTPNGE